VASRRASDQLIQTGKVEVNGLVVTHPGTRVDPDVDVVRCAGKIATMVTTHTYVLLNKPADYLVSVTDPHHQKTVFGLLEGVTARVFPVGRLDLDTRGVLLLTDDGDLSYRLTHPRYEVEKVYRGLVRGRPSAEALGMLSKGIVLEDGITAPARVKLVRQQGANTVLELTLHEGRKRQVKLMCAAVGHRVLELTRIVFGTLDVNDLELGQWRALTEKEVVALYALVGLGQVKSNIGKSVKGS
jgi:23S rRNA pseudouridine2605 synthase